MFDAVRRFDESAELGCDAADIFEPEVIELMRKALDAAWSALAFAHFDDEREMRATREELARRILEAAASGERRVRVLSGRALGALEPRRAAPTPKAFLVERPWPVTGYDS